MAVLRLPAISKVHVDERALELAGLVAAAIVLQLCAGVGMSYVAGFHAMDRVLASVRWPWIGAVVGGLVVALLGNFYATRGVYRVDGGSRLGDRHVLSVVLGGFGGILARGGSGLDRYAAEAGGDDGRDAASRAAALGGLEHGVLALFGTAAGITVLVAGLSHPPPDFSVPWAVIPVPGFALGFWAAARYEPRLRGRGGWHEKASTFLAGIGLIRRLFWGDLWSHPAVPGMVVFWAGEMFAIWAGLAAFGFRMNAAQLVLGAATGMVFTRRTGPLAGAGILVVTLAPSIWYSGAPLAVVVAGVFAYRALSLWLFMPAALAQVPALRAIGRRRREDSPGRAAEGGEPALPDPETG